MQNAMNFAGNMGMNMMFGGGMSNGDGANGGHNIGPVRRGGGRFNNRNGPYDKNNRRGYGNMNNLMQSNAGRMGFIAQGGGGGGGKWGDGAGPAANAIGPKEAVQGRSIRSYEDLDAQPSGGRPSGAAANGGGNADAGLDY